MDPSLRKFNEPCSGTCSIPLEAWHSDQRTVREAFRAYIGLAYTCSLPLEVRHPDLCETWEAFREYVGLVHIGLQVGMIYRVYSGGVM